MFQYIKNKKIRRVDIEIASKRPPLFEGLVVEEELELLELLLELLELVDEEHERGLAEHSYEL